MIGFAAIAMRPELGARVHLGIDHFTAALAVLVSLLLLIVLCASRYRETRERGDLWYTVAFLLGATWQLGDFAFGSLTEAAGAQAQTIVARVAGHLHLGAYLVTLLVATTLHPRYAACPGARRLVHALVAGLGISAFLAFAVETGMSVTAARHSIAWETAFHGSYLIAALAGLASCRGVSRPHHVVLGGVWLLLASSQALRLAELHADRSDPLFAAIGDSTFLVHAPALLLAVSLRERGRWRRARGQVETQFSELIGALDEIVQAGEPRRLPGAGTAGRLARDLATRLGLDEDHREAVYRAALVRDLGKIFLDRRLFTEARRLTPDEWTRVKEHPVAGAQVLSRISGLQRVAEIVRHHHERWDGTGYPARLAGESIPIGSRIVGVIDTFEALVGGRSYQPARTVLDALVTISSLSGSHFDPTVVRCLAEVLDERHIPDSTPRTAPVSTALEQA